MGKTYLYKCDQDEYRVLDRNHVQDISKAKLVTFSFYKKKYWTAIDIVFFVVQKPYIIKIIFLLWYLDTTYLGIEFAFNIFMCKRD